MDNIGGDCCHHCYTAGAALNGEDLFTSRDLEQTADLSEAVTLAVKNGENISITEAGVYVLSGSAENVTVTVDAEDAKVQIVLDNVSVVNTDFPVLYVKSADKVFITTAEAVKTACPSPAPSRKTEPPIPMRSSSRWKI